MAPRKEIPGYIDIDHCFARITELQEAEQPLS